MDENIAKLESKELAQAKKLIDECKFDEADQLIKIFEEKGGYTFHDIILCHLLKCELLMHKGLHNDVVELAEQTYKESLGLGKNRLSVDVLLIMAHGLLCLFQTDKAYDITKQGEELLKTLTQELPADYKQREAYIAFLKGWVYEQKTKADPAIKKFELSILLRKELGVKKEIAYSLVGLAHVFMYRKGDYSRALNYLKQGLAYAEESGNKWMIGYCLFYMAQLHGLKGELDHSIILNERSLTIYNEIGDKISVTRILNSLGDTYAIRGELNSSIRFYEQCLEISKGFNNKLFMAMTFNNLSNSYRMKGELDHALKYIEQSMGLYHELGNLRNIALNHYSFIQLLIEMSDLERAWESFRDLEQIKNQLNDKIVNLAYLFDKALLLKTSPRAHNRVKAEKLLKQILEEEDLSIDFLINVLLNLCELLLIELQITNDVEILEEINPFVTQLLNLSDKAHSFWILGETYLLQAKLALISLNLEEARKLLTKGQKIAEKYGLILLARKISNEHDELLKRLDMWENLKESETSLADRMGLARLNDQMEKMIRTRTKDIPQVSDEEPVLLLIVSEGGRPIFSQSFLEDKSFEDHLFGGFFTAINSFINEKFSEGLDRAIFGEHTLLMNSVSPFYMCYVYKGQSYSAQTRIKSFIKKIKENKDVWDTFEKFYQLNKEIQMKDIPSLKPLIKDIFIEKTIH
ncbi:MAG: tetratricopeptide repeat protein [Candidatus Thorarchaeota archaeon]